MKLKKKLINAIVSASLLGAVIAAPAAAQDWTVTYSNGQMQVQQSQQGGRFKVFNFPVTQNQTYGYQETTYTNNQCPNQGGGFYSQNQQPVYTPVNQPQYSECDNQPTYTYSPTETQQPTPVATTVNFEQEVLNLTNQARAQHGLAPLQSHQSLGQAASSHSQEMLALNYFSHTSPTAGRSGPSDRVLQAGANPNFIAENIFQASGHDTASVAQLAVDSWLQSPGHRRNMLSPQATHIGIGFVEMNGTVSVTQVFGAGL